MSVIEPLVDQHAGQLVSYDTCRGRGLLKKASRVDISGAVCWPLMGNSGFWCRWRRLTLCMAFLLGPLWVKETLPEHRDSIPCSPGQLNFEYTCFAGASPRPLVPVSRLLSKAAIRFDESQGERIWWVKMNSYQQQVWALSNALAGLLRDSEASKFPPKLRAKTMELQQSCNGLQQYISTSTSRIQFFGFAFSNSRFLYCTSDIPKLYSHSTYIHIYSYIHIYNICNAHVNICKYHIEIYIEILL